MIDIPRIRNLVHAAPGPPGEPVPDGVSDDQIAGFELRTGAPMPPELKDWLLISNGPCIGPGGLFGIKPARDDLDIELHFELYPNWLARKWIAIAGDGCGNYYVVATQQEYGPGYPVFFIDCHEDTDVPSYIAASGVGHFLIFLLEREIGARGWPFDERYVVAADPNIRRFHSLSLPWNA